MRSHWTVVVGNVGTVHGGHNQREALKRFKDYVKISQSGQGRAGSEDVTLFKDAEIFKEHSGQSTCKTCKPNCDRYLPCDCSCHEPELGE